MKKLVFKIPRAIYYMDFFEPLKSLFKWFSGKGKSGPKVQEFEEAFKQLFGHEHLTIMPHARVSLYFCLKSYEYDLGDEVLMTPVNLPDMVNMIRICGLRERYVDINRHDYSIDLEDAKNKLSTRTKFLFVTHLNGIVPDMDAILKFAGDHNLILIQDCTQSIDCRYNGKRLETYSELSFMALCDLKVIHTHMGGMIVSQNSERLKRIKKIADAELLPLSPKYLFRFVAEDMIANILLNRVLFSIIIFPIMRFLTIMLGANNIQGLTRGDGLKIGNIIILKSIFGGGGNLLRESVPDYMLYRFSTLQAEIGLKRLRKFKEIDQKRIENSKKFHEFLDIGDKYTAKYEDDRTHVYWKFPIIVKDYERLHDHLCRFGIDSARSNLPCLSTLEHFKGGDQTPNAEFMVNSSLYIPLHYYLNDKEISFIAGKVTEFFSDGSL
ncbi:MAG: DegT/DnrJ/EryC1/StrS aminotransferase family protein [Bacteriovoracaceae bacterium]|nr:DegT/DnrJ/EryC1/StrS aminotransferase family protein [Bacteriovoracaceae bacterium]